MLFVLNLVPISPGRRNRTRTAWRLQENDVKRRISSGVFCGTYVRICDDKHARNPFPVVGEKELERAQPSQVTSIHPPYRPFQEAFMEIEKKLANTMAKFEKRRASYTE